MPTVAPSSETQKQCRWESRACRVAPLWVCSEECFHQNQSACVCTLLVAVRGAVVINYHFRNIRRAEAQARPPHWWELCEHTEGCTRCSEVAVCSVVQLITYLEWQALYPHEEHFLSLESPGSVENPCPKQLKMQRPWLGKIKPTAIVLKWCKPTQQWSFMSAAILALNI